MPRPARPWLRLHAEIAYNPKFHEMPDRLVKPWVILLGLACVATPRGSLPALKTCAYHMRVKEEKAKGIIAALVTLHWIDFDGTHYVMHDWDEHQKDSDVNASPGRSKRHAGNAVGTPLEHGRNTVGTLSERLEEEGEKEVDQEKEVEGEEEARAPANPFAFTYARHYQQRHAGNPPAAVEHAAALAIEREFGADACIQLGNDLDWQKHPNYMRPILEERRNGKPSQTRRVSGRREGSDPESVLAGWEAYAAGDG